MIVEQRIEERMESLPQKARSGAAKIRAHGGSPAARRRPPGPPAVLGVRNLVRFARDPLRLLRELADRYGDVVEMNVVGTPWFIFNHPDDIEAVLVKHARIMERDLLANSPEAILRLPAWVPTPRNVHMNRAVQKIDEVVFRIIARRRVSEPRDDLLGTLLAAQDDDGLRMSDQQLRDEAVTLFLAGHETTALVLAHTFYLLSKHPDVERRLHAEVEAVLGGQLPTADDVRTLVYADRVLKESMRLYPPAWTTGRQAAEDVEIGGYLIP